MLYGEYTFSWGHIDVSSKTLDVGGTGTFVYESGEDLEIWYYSTLKLDKGITFSYAPITSNRDGIYMYDETSELYLNGASLRSTTTGLRLTSGTLVIDHKNYFFNEDNRGRPGAAASEAIQFGDGDDADYDLKIEVMPGGSVDLRSGVLNYQNVQQ